MGMIVPSAFRLGFLSLQATFLGFNFSALRPIPFGVQATLPKGAGHISKVVAITSLLRDDAAISPAVNPFACVRALRLSHLLLLRS